MPHIREKSRFFLIYTCFFLLFVLFFSNNPSAAAEDNSFKLLKQRLISDGFDKVMINKIYNNAEMKFNSKSVSSFFMHNESKLNYGRFTSAKLISNARKYKKKHAKDLLMAEKDYGVDKNIITAILLVETKLGKYTGKSVVFTTLSTMAALHDPLAKKKLWEDMPKKNRLSMDAFNKKVQKRSKWAYNELKAFIKYTARESIPPFKVKGSYAGAMGFAQFMPSNILTLAIDGNSDGKVDLFNHTDAICSIANFLRRYGWRPGIDRKQAGKVIYYYNHSKYYVKTILDIADILKK